MVIEMNVQQGAATQDRRHGHLTDTGVRRIRIHTSLALLCVAAGCWQTANHGRAQGIWQSVPDQALASIVIQQPAKIADLLLTYLDAAAEDPQFVEVLTVGDDPLCESDKVELLFDTVREWIALFRSCRSVGVFVTEFEPSYKYCVIVELSTEDVGVTRPLPLPLTWLTESMGLDESIKKAERGSEVGRGHEFNTTGSGDPNRHRLQLLVAEFLSRIQVAESRVQGKWLVFGNSRELVEGALAGCMATGLPQGWRPIVESRRFARARQLSDERRRGDVEGYFSPNHLLPWLDKKYTPQYLETLGFSELVGAWCELTVPETKTTRPESGFSFRLAVPYTVPPLGITEVWQCSAPITTAPDLRGLLERFNLKPDRLVIQNVDRPKQLATMERIYREKNDLEGLNAYWSNALRISGSLELDVRAFSGYTYLLQFQHREPGYLRGSLHVTSTKNPDAALELVRQVAKKENEVLTLQFKQFYFGDFEGWFLDDKDQLAQAIKNGMDEQLVRSSEKVPNSGMLAMNRWIAFVDRFIAEALDGKEPDAIDARLVLAEFDRVLVEVLDEVQPWWLEVSFPEFREGIRVASLRFNYLCTFMDQREARRRQNSSLSLALETRSDRMYAASEWLFRRFLNQLGPDVQAFASRDGFFEWHWRANWIARD